MTSLGSFLLRVQAYERAGLFAWSHFLAMAPALASWATPLLRSGPLVLAWLSLLVWLGWHPARGRERALLWRGLGAFVATALVALGAAAIFPPPPALALPFPRAARAASAWDRVPLAAAYVPLMLSYLWARAPGSRMLALLAAAQWAVRLAVGGEWPGEFLALAACGIAVWVALGSTGSAWRRLGDAVHGLLGWEPEPPP